MQILELFGQHLERLLRRKRGRIGAVEDSVGYSRGALSRIARGRFAGLGSKRFYSALELLGEEPVPFMRRALASVNAETLLEELALRPETKAMRDLRKVGHQLEEGLMVRTRVGSPADQKNVSVAHGAEADGGATSQQGLAEVMTSAKELRSLRCRDPHAAARKARTLAIKVCPTLPSRYAAEVFCEVVGTLASAHLAFGEPKVAAGTLLPAITLAYRCGPETEAALLTRVSEVLRDAGRLRTALKVVKEVSALTARHGDILGFHRSLVVRGVILLLQGQFAAAIDLLEKVLPNLTATERRYRASALYTIGSCYSSLGEPQKATGYLSQAEALIAPEESQDRAALCYARAALARESGNADLCLLLLREARSLTPDPFDKALITLDILELMLNERRHAEAREESVALRPLLHPLRAHPAVPTLLRELCRLDRSLELQRLVEIRQAVQRARGRGQGPPLSD